jgi:hypothetical protein
MIKAARRHRTTRNMMALNPAAALADHFYASHPLMQEVFEPVELRYSRLVYLLCERSKVHLEWYNPDVISNIDEINNGIRSQRRNGLLRPVEEEDEYEEELTLHQLSASMDGTDPETGSLVKRMKRSTLTASESSSDSKGMFL